MRTLRCKIVSIQRCFAEMFFEERDDCAWKTQLYLVDGSWKIQSWLINGINWKELKEVSCKVWATMTTKMCVKILFTDSYVKIVHECSNPCMQTWKKYIKCIYVFPKFQTRYHIYLKTLKLRDEVYNYSSNRFML